MDVYPALYGLSIPPDSDDNFEGGNNCEVKEEEVLAAFALHRGMQEFCYPTAAENEVAKERVEAAKAAAQGPWLELKTEKETFDDIKHGAENVTFPDPPENGIALGFKAPLLTDAKGGLLYKNSLFRFVFQKANPNSTYKEAAAAALDAASDAAARPEWHKAMGSTGATGVMSVPTPGKWLLKERFAILVTTMENMTMFSGDMLGGVAYKDGVLCPPVGEAPASTDPVYYQWKGSWHCFARGHYVPLDPQWRNNVLHQLWWRSKKEEGSFQFVGYIILVPGTWKIVEEHRPQAYFRILGITRADIDNPNNCGLFPPAPVGFLKKAT